MDCLLYYGPRRPDWSRTGAPSAREVAEMRWHRRQVLGGYLSLTTANAHVEAVARMGGGPSGAHVVPQQAQSVRAALGMTSPIPRPPGVPDDDPDVLAGVYA